MILTCPACSANFTVQPQALGATGRQVRCGKCRHEWHASAPLITVADTLPSIRGQKVTRVKPGAAGKEAPPRLLRKRSIVFAVIAALLVTMPFFGMKLGPYFSHPVAKPVEDIVRAVTLEGVPVTMLRQEEGRAVLDIKGVLINRSGALQPVPVLKASALNARGHAIKEWTIPLTATKLEAGQRLPFTFSTPLAEQGVEDIAFKLM